jgi:hypothetical protein
MTLFSASSATARVIAHIRESANEQRPRRLGRLAERKLRFDILLDELLGSAPFRGENLRSYLRVVRGPIETSEALPAHFRDGGARPRRDGFRRNARYADRQVDVGPLRDDPFEQRAGTRRVYRGDRCKSGREGVHRAKHAGLGAEERSLPAVRQGRETPGYRRD